MNILFLDYDGVVNIPMWEYDEPRDKYICKYAWPSDGKVNSYQAVQWVSEFCEKYGYALVISSSWRRYDNCIECLINGGLRPGIKIVGTTDRIDGGWNRGEEIQQWLDSHAGEVDNYLILDDDRIEGHDDHFLQITGDAGFGIYEYQLLECKHLALVGGFKLTDNNIMEEHDHEAS